MSVGAILNSRVVVDDDDVYMHLYSPIYMVAEIRKNSNNNNNNNNRKKERKKPYYCTND